MIKGTWNRRRLVGFLAGVVLVTLAGCGSPPASSGGQTASPAAPTTTTQITTQNVTLPEGQILQWKREGGLAGFCDQITVYDDDRAIATACEAGLNAERGRRVLSSDQSQQVRRWRDVFASFEADWSDQAALGLLQVHVVFIGQGTAKPTSSDVDAIQTFAAALLTEATVPADSLIPFPDESAAYAAAAHRLARQLGVQTESMKKVSVSSREWPDRCLGLNEPGESCAQIITPGYEVKIAVGTDSYTCRTNADGSIARCLGP